MGSQLQRQSRRFPRVMETPAPSLSTFLASTSHPRRVCHLSVPAHEPWRPFFRPEPTLERLSSKLALSMLPAMWPSPRPGAGPSRRRRRCQLSLLVATIRGHILSTFLVASRPGRRVFHSPVQGPGLSPPFY